MACVAGLSPTARYASRVVASTKARSAAVTRSRGTSRRKRLVGWPSRSYQEIVAVAGSDR